MLPIKTKICGTAPVELPDIIDETLDLFRANLLFLNFKIKEPADHTLFLLILYTFPIPGNSGLPLNTHYAPPLTKFVLDKLRQYLVQVRQELAAVEYFYADGTGKPSKWWMSFQKRRFMDRSLG
ncbi:actin-related protein 2/3 complex subunit 3 [Mycena capillaripes]|nr:actin-related protein 2/3 complex subunit 3 [Mycena capillaripes]